MKRFFVMFLASIGIITAFPPLQREVRAQDQDTTEPRLGFNATKAMQWLPLAGDEQNGIITVPVTVNGQATLAEIDTGLSTPGVAVISSKLLSNAGKAVGGKTVSSDAYGGAGRYVMRRVESLVVGGATLLNQPVAATERTLSKDGRVGAVIGINLLMGLALQVDWEHGRARFLLGGDLPKDEHTAMVVIDSRSKLPFVDANICGTTVKALLDTGTNSDLRLVPEQENLWECASVARSTIRGNGAGGPVISGLVSLPAVHIGKRPMGPALASIDPEGGPLSALGSSASVGTGLLRRSNFVLDIGNAALAFYGPDRSAKVIDRTRIGIQYRVDGNGLLITHLMKGSPASQTILKANDRICALNGKAIETLAGRYGDINPRVGQTTRIGLCGGPTVSIVARDFLAFPGAPDAALPAGAPAVSEPAGVGKVTGAFARCVNGDLSGEELAGACSIVLNAPAVANYWKEIARTKRAAALSGAKSPGSR
ncbi:MULTISPECIES: pepsin/retropepsin-like aspartic protease family protein [unclassified Sphingomonas]|uniref:pepsin/retropepsin-like aspartic protease family protein n=1 Tax=Sphingomonas TaxID=13687 RepID=UPI00095FC286|nr:MULTISPECIES: aspartyl protease family protein [unclassified Sphingomonas]MBN8809885.1 aspartyl protease family protein [Sphingomonas sp.]OJY50497.1 MAG: hypothetical protein BGP17_18805 [Sphingomonas sp. 67-41]